MADISDVAALQPLFDRIGEAEDAILAAVPPDVRALFDLARSVSLLAASMHGLPEAMRVEPRGSPDLDEFRAVARTLQTCADNLGLGVVLSVETRQ